MMKRLKEVGIILLLLSFTLTKETDSGSKYCAESLNTMRNVDSCPSSEQEARNAAEKMNCEAISHNQNCTDPDKFKYHCVIDELEKSLLEVCAPEYYILDYCAEFNVQGGRIQEHYGTKCSDVTPQCPRRYKSAEAYLYPGCYEVVTRSSEFISTEESTSIQHAMDITNGSNDNSNAYVRIWLPVVVACIVIGIGIIVCLRRGICRTRCRKRRGKEHRNDEASGLMMCEQPDYERETEVISTISATDELAVFRGEILLKMMEKNEKVEEKTVLSEDNIKKTKEYIEAFRDLCSFFVETKLSTVCKTALRHNGVAILTGPSGSGKTLVALHIIKDPFYDTWDKRKISSWREFRLINPKKNSFVLIDNIFDGHIYRHGLETWWDTLSCLYSKYIKSPKSQNNATAVGKVHLLITAKDNAIRKASQFMNRDTPALESDSIIPTSSFPLSDTEKNNILDAQLEYAHEKKGIERPVIDKEFRHQIMKTIGPFGFPLCAHLYACEQNYGKKDLNVFRYPENYQRNLIKHEISMDKTYSVKSLLLFLLLYDTDSVIRGELTKPNLNDSEQCSQFLESACSKEMVDELQPLNFSNLTIVSSGLTGTILIEHPDNLYGFIHQTFKNAVAFHFCTEHFDTAVNHFPLDVLEKQSFERFPEDQCRKLMSRFMKEIPEGNISKVFACPVFKQQWFSKQFVNAMVSCNISEYLSFPDSASTFNLPLIFWVSKYCLTSLSRYLFEEIEKQKINEELNFLLARFGDCCAADESFLRESAAIAASPTIENLRERVLVYRNKEKHSILHLVLLSEQPDVVCYRIMECLLKYSAFDSFCDSGESILNVTIKQQNCSRILCTLATLNKCKKVQIRPQIAELVKLLDGCEYKVSLEIEMLTRLCILLVYSPDSSVEGEVCRNFPHVQTLLNLPRRSENKMLEIINETCRDLSERPDEEKEIRIPNPMGKMSPNLLERIRKIVRHLGKMDAFP
ncbi:uncharacterized protein LOC130053301 [Ostrea edulis]|uniref:uncharacterized protein LOC130053301 n=1 Tax=Ostrea edulis TaxID=37623 RepID=UPI0024AFFF4A|nr:uncharacterized protein LOC130053301 [Ostrea edulis]